MLCKFIFIGGWLALFGVYAFANPDFVTPVAGEAKPNAFDADNNPILFTEEEAKGPIHCSVSEVSGALVVCEPCYHPYATCEQTDKTPAWSMLFLFGFIINALPIITTILMCLGSSDPAGGMAKCAGLFVCLNCIGSLAWMIASCVFRFSLVGNAVAGTP